VIQNCSGVPQEIMLKFLLYTAVRASELVGIRIGNINLEQCKIFIPARPLRSPLSGSVLELRCSGRFMVRDGLGGVFERASFLAGKW